VVPELLAHEKMRIRDDPGPGRLQFQFARGVNRLQLEVQVVRAAPACVNGVRVTDDTRKILAVNLNDLKEEEERRGRSEHARSDDCHGFEFAAACKLNLKSAAHAEILTRTLVNAEDPIEEVD
jgi:hypothetical protein